jgi:hypothetical protein
LTSRQRLGDPYMSETPRKQSESSKEFSRLAGKQAPGILRQAWQLIAQERKWYLLPLLLAFLLVGGFVMLGGSGVAPLLYALF